MPRRSCALLIVGCSLLGAIGLRAEDPHTADVQVLRAASLPAHGPGLLAFFKKRTLSPAQREKIAGLIRQLGDDDFTTREKATQGLVDLGGLARAELARALQADDLEVRKRARTILTKLGSAADESRLLPAAARVLAWRKPEGAAMVLLDFLPCVEDPDLAEEVAQALVPLARGKDGKPDPAVVAALEGRASIKRYAAGCAIARLGAEERAPAKKLLDDPDPGVRRRVALALLEARDKAAVPALIALLTAKSADDATAAESALYALAGEKAPQAPDGDGARAREAYRRGWEAWWKDQEDKLDLAKLDLGAVGRGYTLVATMTTPARTTSGAVMELDARGKARWKIENLNHPVHAAMAGRDRVLICEYYGNRVTERDLKGRVLWQKQVPSQVLSAERLPDGSTFVATRNQLLIFDKDGGEVKAIHRLSDALLAGHRNKDGTFVVLTQAGACVTLDAAGREVRSFPVGFLVPGQGGVKPAFLPGGGVVIPDASHGEVREYDRDGNRVHRFDAYRPTTVVKLASGNYLVASRNRSRVYEVAKNGREVASRETDGMVLFVDRR